MCNAFFPRYTSPSSQDEGRAVSQPLAPQRVHNRGGSSLPSPPNAPIPPPRTAAASQRNPVSTRLRGSHISFNSNIRVLNIHREIGIGWHLQCFQVHSFQVQRQIKNHSGRGVLAPQHPLQQRAGCPAARDFPREKKEVLSDVKPVTKGTLSHVRKQVFWQNKNKV